MKVAKLGVARRKTKTFPRKLAIAPGENEIPLPYLLSASVFQTFPKRDIAADLDGALTAPSKRHHASIIEPARIGQLLRDIDGYAGHGVTLYALKIAPYVFVRPGELRHAEWTEFDLDSAQPQWVIPAHKMKMRVQHIVPLASQVVGLLRELHLLTGPSPSRRAAKFVFPALTTPNRPMSENTENTALRRLG